MGRPKIGICPSCGTYGNLTNHHIYPKRFYGGCGPLERICAPCHQELENFIPKQQKMPDDWYPMIFNWFCKERPHEP